MLTRVYRDGVARERQEANGRRRSGLFRLDLQGKQPGFVKSPERAWLEF